MRGLRQRSPRNFGLLTAALVVLGSALWAQSAPWAQSAQSARADDDRSADFSGLLQSVVRVRCGGELSSGTIVSADGTVLTVAHGLPDPVRRIVVEQPVPWPGEPPAARGDERSASFSATLIHLDRDNDLAVLRMDVPADWGGRVLPVAADDGPAPGSVVYAAGLPARSPTGPVILRRGRIRKISRRYAHTSCRLTAGDSGGPLISATGRLVGVNARVGLGRETNLHVRLSVVRQALAAARVSLPAEEPLRLPDSVASSAVARQTWRAVHHDIRSAGQPGPPWSCSRIGQRDFVAKHSLLPEGKLEVRGVDGWIAVTRTTVRLADDLVSLQAATADGLAEYQMPQTAEVQLGMTVCCAPRESTSVPTGLVTRQAFAEPRMRPTLGCTLDQTADGLVVVAVVASSTAAEAGLRPGDLLLSLSGRDTPQFDDLATALEPLAAGDRIALVYTRDGRRRTVSAQLQPAASVLLDRTEFLDGRSGALSERRTGFSQVFQHDASLAPGQMGAPVVSEQGELLGINIAVRGREAVLAVPWSVVRSLQQPSPSTLPNR